MRHRWLIAASIVLLSTSAVTTEPCPPDAFECACPFENSERVGVVSGKVLAGDVALPLQFANLALIADTGETCGVVSGPDGGFSMTNVPVGRYELKALFMGCKPLSQTVRVGADDAPLTLRLENVGLSTSQAQAESIGADVHVDASDFTLEITLAQPPRVGEAILLRVLVHNDGLEDVVLCRALDGSVDGDRYPRIVATVAGPENGVDDGGYFRFCANQKALRAENLVEVAAGATFDLFGGQPFRLNTTIVRPGRYEVTITYSTDEADVRKWQGWPGLSEVPAALAQGLRRVPRITLSSSLELQVDG